MAYIYNLYELEDIKIGPDYSTAHGGWVPGERLQVLLYNKAKGTGSRPHRHPNEQFIFVMEGRARATVEGQEKVVGPGEIVHMPANSLHNVMLLNVYAGRMCTVCVSPSLVNGQILPMRSRTIQDMSVRS